MRSGAFNRRRIMVVMNDRRRRRIRRISCRATKWKLEEIPHLTVRLKSLVADRHGQKEEKTETASFCVLSGQLHRRRSGRRI